MPTPKKLPRPRVALDIDRPLRRDSKALRDAELFVRRNLYNLEQDEKQWLYDQYQIAYARILNHMSEVYDSDGNPRLVMRAQLLEQIEREMLNLYAQIVQHEDAVFVEAYKRGLYGRAWALDMATRDDIVIGMPQMLPNEAIRAALLAPATGRKGKYLGATWATELNMDRDVFIASLKRSITQSLIQGEGMKAAARRLLKELGIPTSPTQPFRAASKQAFSQVRTEIMRASNQGALAIYEENQDILQGWEWAATRSERTCDFCAGEDGKVHKFGSSKIPPPMGSHPNCRCTPIPVLIDTALQDRVSGIRTTYQQWKAQQPIVDDGGMSKGKAA